MDLGLTDRVVIVTGGTDGLGRVLCRSLVAEGAKVALCGRDPERLKTVAEELSDGDVLALAADVSRAADLAEFVDAVVDRWGHIDGLVNNAGKKAALALADSTDEEWEDDLALKVMAAVRLTRLILPHVSAQAAIVNTLAVSAKAPAALSAPSSVSRAAGLALTKVLSKELGPQGIRVNAVLVGVVESAQWERIAAAADVPIDEWYRRRAESWSIPLGRVGRGEEFADLVSFLLSDRSSYITGTSINLDGGLSSVV